MVFYWVKSQKNISGACPRTPRSSRLRRLLHAFGVSARNQAALVRPTTIQNPRYAPDYKRKFQA